MKDFLRPEVLNRRRQDLPPFYRLNGAVYLSERDYFIKRNGFMGSGTFAYEMSQEHSIDIDSKTDFMICECLLQGGIKND